MVLRLKQRWCLVTYVLVTVQSAGQIFHIYLRWWPEFLEHLSYLRGSCVLAKLTSSLLTAEQLPDRRNLPAP